MKKNHIMGSPKDPPLISEDSEEDDQITDLPTATVSSAVRWRGKVKKRKHRPNKLKHFERRYTELGPLLKPEQKRVDYILVHPKKTSKEATDKSKKKSLEEKEFKRELFEKALEKEGFSVQKDEVESNIFVKLHCPFKRLCLEAERVKLEMRLKDCPAFDAQSNRLVQFIEKYFETDDEVDFISAPFLMDRIQLYEDYEDPTHFFRPSQRSLLVDHILMNIDIRRLADKKKKIKRTSTSEDPNEVEETGEQSIWSCLPCVSSDKSDTNSSEIQLQKWESVQGSEENNIDDEDEDEIFTLSSQRNQPGKRHGLPYLMMKEVYTDAFILHEDSQKCKEKEDIRSKFFNDDEVGMNDPDPRKELDDSWTKFYKFQPLWKIRNYFGEKIALYFAWSGMLITSLWIPTLFGFAIFLYGLVLSIEKSDEATVPLAANATALQKIKYEMINLYDVIKSAFDNDVTPFFALVICLWGTIFLEFWKRKSATLAYEWDVDNYDAREPDRPQFFGTKLKKDPVTLEFNWFYSVKRQFLKYTCSVSALILMVSLVFASLAGVIVYRVILSVDVCPSMTAVQCLVTTNIVSAILNAVSILLLGRVYERVAIMLTEWENHRTQSAYDDNLIIKLFAFQFANSYASCVYIAFFRGTFDIFGVFGLGEEYRDECHGTCMSQLSFQVLILMLAKPFPKMFKDIILPFVRKLWRKRPHWCCRCNCCACCQNRVDTEQPTDKIAADKCITSSYAEIEFQKPTLGDFTLSEYTEKIIQYGFLMLFAASFPLAPLLALLTLLIDIRVDAKRMLWWYRRPIAYIRKDIGRWYGILEFVNMVGVISNGFLIAFTSSWGQKYEYYTKLWIVIGFEHIVFALKFILAYLIPDVPREIKLAIRREKFQVSRILEMARGEEPTDYTNLVPVSKKRRKTRSSNYETFEDDVAAVLASNANESEELNNKLERPPADGKLERPPADSKLDSPLADSKLDKPPARPPAEKPLKPKPIHAVSTVYTVTESSPKSVQDSTLKESPITHNSNGVAKDTIEEDKLSLKDLDEYSSTLKSSEGELWYCNNSKQKTSPLKPNDSSAVVSISGVDTKGGAFSSQEALKTPRPAVVEEEHQTEL